MKLTFTEAACIALEKKQASEQLSLYYDAGTDVCACANSGIFILRAYDSESAYDATIASNLGPIKAQKSALIYLDQDNIIDYKTDTNAFILKSERGYLNLNMRLELNVKHTV